MSNSSANERASFTNPFFSQNNRNVDDLLNSVDQRQQHYRPPPPSGRSSSGMENPSPPPFVPTAYPPHNTYPDVVVDPPPPLGYPRPVQRPQSVQHGTVTVIGPQYSMPHIVDLVVAKTDIRYYSISDVEGKVIFKVERKVPSFSHRRVLLDSTGNPIVAMKKKVPSMHHRWQVFRGNSYEDCDLLFSVKTSSEKGVDVFLTANDNEMNCDFKIEGWASKRSCTIYSGNSDNIIAQMHEKKNLKGLFGWRVGQGWLGPTRVTPPTKQGSPPHSLLFTGVPLPNPTLSNPATKQALRARSGARTPTALPYTPTWTMPSS